MNNLRKMRETTAGKDRDNVDMNIIRVQEEIDQLERRQEKLLNDSNLGKKFRDRTFNNFDRKRNEKAYDDAVMYASTFKDQFGKGLIFMGSVGTGKTHLAAAITHYLTEHGIPVKFGNIVELFDSIRDAYSTDDEILSELKGLPVLVIDDLGKERKTDWTTEKIYEIVNYRYEHELPIIVTTNCTREQLQKRLGEATMSRVMEMCKPIVMVGDDMRRRKE